MRRVHSGHATKTEQALTARTAHVPLPAARHPQHDSAPSADNPTEWDEDDSIDDLEDRPDTEDDGTGLPTP